jgi:hypothetical protein
MSAAPLRALGFGLTAAGALLAGATANDTWMRIGFRGDVGGVLDSEFAGTDLLEGIAVLVLAGATLVALLLVRRARMPLRLIAAAAILVFGIAMVLLPVWVALRAEDRALDETARTVAGSTGMSVDEAADLIRTEPDLAFEVDTSLLFLPIAGGGLVVLGGATSLVWVRRTLPTPAVR